MQLELSDIDVEVLRDCVEMLIAQHEHAKKHTLGCVSVESAEMLLEVTRDYELRLESLQRIDTQLRSKSV